MPNVSGLTKEGVDRLAMATMARCDALAECSEEPGRVTRRFLTPPMRTVHERLTSWMRDAGLTTRVDAAGNLIGRRPASHGDRVLIVGSHLDSVPGAGRYDGVLGVVMGLALAEALRDTPLPFHLDVVGFSEEEGVRFGKPYLGSSAVAGCFEREWLRRTDRAGSTLRDAIVDFGCDPDRIDEAAYSEDEVIGYLEPHLEQGPVLERSGAAVGVVSGIVGQSRLRLAFVGEAGHAGTTPMAGRRDALVAAAGFVTEVRRLAAEAEDLIATVGKLEVFPNAPNVIPERAEVSLDVRHPSDAAREQAVNLLLEEAERLACEAEVDVSVIDDSAQAAVAVDRELTDALAETIAESGREPLRLASGAGHDAVVMAKRFPVAMLFVRHPGGVSHHPDERVDRDDVAAGIGVLARCVTRLAARVESTSRAGVAP